MVIRMNDTREGRNDSREMNETAMIIAFRVFAGAAATANRKQNSITDVIYCTYCLSCTPFSIGRHSDFSKYT